MATHGEDMATHGEDMATHGEDMATHGENMATHGENMATEECKWADEECNWADEEGNWETEEGNFLTEEQEAELKRLTAQHGFYLEPAVSCSLTEVCLAVGEMVGYDSLKAADRVYGKVMIYVDSIEKAKQIVESGVVIKNTLTPAVAGFPAPPDSDRETSSRVIEGQLEE